MIRELSVLRRNPEFRRLWFAQVVSQGGDWLTHVAVLKLVGDLSGSQAQLGIGLLYGLEIALRFLPATLLGPLAGPIADRLPRRLLMIGADLLRGALVLLLLLVDEPGDLPLLYSVLAAQMATSIFFDSARSASVPNTLRDPSDLHAAYAVSAATWSTMLSIGAFTGGLLVTWLGARGVFAVDAVTYLVSAITLIGLRLPPPPTHPAPFRAADVFLLRDLRRGYAHLRERGGLAGVFAKTFWSPVGGLLVLLGIAGSERFPALDPDLDPGRAIGLLYAARGVGTGLGPILGRKFLGTTEGRLRLQITIGFGVGALGYAGFAFAESFWVAFGCVAFAHSGGSALWVGSTTLWQSRADDAFRGRVHALEFLCLTLAFSTTAVLAGLLYDASEDFRATVLAVSAAVAVSGALWTYLARRASRQ